MSGDDKHLSGRRTRHMIFRALSLSSRGKIFRGGATASVLAVIRVGGMYISSTRPPPLEGISIPLTLEDEAGTVISGGPSRLPTH
jgi:hypothetical protein